MRAKGAALVSAHRVVALIAALTVLVPAAAAAETYPVRTVTIVVPYPAGGSVDGVARYLADELADRLKVSVVVENRAGGAGGIVGAATVARAAPDGATLMLTASIHVVTPFLFRHVPYDVVKDFTPISLVASGPLIVSTSKSTPASNLAEFFALVRKDPDKFTFATSSRGSAGHLTVELLKRQAGLDTLVVAYRGAGPALIDVIGGRVQLMADPFLSSLPHVQAGELKALAVTSLKRVALAPDIPTIAESGMQGFEMQSWYGFWGPKGLSADLVAALESAVRASASSPKFKERLNLLGFEPIGTSAAAFKTYIDDEIAKNGKIVHDAGIQAE
jgi:tripartite-type tricarboxylate transporter receptor subunit TctC